MKFEKLLRAVGILDKPQLGEIDKAVMARCRYLSHNPMVYGVTRRMVDGQVHHKISDPSIPWGTEGVYHPRLWLVPNRGAAVAEVEMKRINSGRWTEITFETFSIPKADAILLPCYNTMKYSQQKEYLPQ